MGQGVKHVFERDEHRVGVLIDLGRLNVCGHPSSRSPVAKILEIIISWKRCITRTPLAPRSALSHGMGSRQWMSALLVSSKERCHNRHRPIKEREGYGRIGREGGIGCVLCSLPTVGDPKSMQVGSQGTMWRVGGAPMDNCRTIGKARGKRSSE